MYRTPTEDFESQSMIFNRNSFSSCLPYNPMGGPHTQQERKISIQVKQLEMGVVQRTYDMKVSLK